MIKDKSCASMVDISSKEMTARRAKAQGYIVFNSKAFKILRNEGSPKGNVLEAARIAGIMAAKSTPAIIPLCHPLNLEKVQMDFKWRISQNTLCISSEVFCWGKTGVEMEALTAVAAACLTVYDMMKFAGQDMTIKNIELTHKSGGKTGVYHK